MQLFDKITGLPTGNYHVSGYGILPKGGCSIGVIVVENNIKPVEISKDQIDSCVKLKITTGKNTLEVRRDGTRVLYIPERYVNQLLSLKVS